MILEIIFIITIANVIAIKINPIYFNFPSSKIIFINLLHTKPITKPSYFITISSSKILSGLIPGSEEYFHLTYIHQAIITVTAGVITNLVDYCNIPVLVLYLNYLTNKSPEFCNSSYFASIRTNNYSVNLHLNCSSEFNYFYL